MRKILLPIGIMIFIIIAAITISINFSKKKVTEGNNKVNPVVLEKYADSPATVSFLTVGETNNDESHRAIRITISKNQRLLEVLKGYNYIIINSQSYYNNVEAYKPFLASLQVAGFAKTKRNPKITNPLGRCPLGNKYFFSSTDIPNISNNLWSSTCSSMGTFGGNFSTVEQLFQTQIPDYSKLTSNVTL